MATRYYTGTEAPSPLILHLKRSDGVAFNLVPYQTVTVEGDELPTGPTAVIDALNGVVQRSFDDGFASAGALALRVRMETGGGVVDFTDPAVLHVYDPAPGSVGIVTTDQVETITGTLVSENDIAMAQSVIGLVVGKDLTNVEWYIGLGTSDQYWLKQAVAWQSTGGNDTVGANSPVAAGAPLPQGVTSVSVGDVSLGFAAATTAYDSMLLPLCQLAVRRLSWMGLRAIHLQSATASQLSNYGYMHATVSDDHAWYTL